MHRRVRFRVAVLGALVPFGLSLSGCDTTDPPTPTQVVVSPTTVNLDAVGAAQQLSAEVRDERNEPLPDEPISWSSKDVTVATVSASGLVTAVGNGMTDVTATSGELSTSAAVTVAQVGTSLQKVSGDGQTGGVGLPLNDSIVVAVVDRLRSPVPDHAVRFQVDVGHGTASPDSADTGATGRAATEWTVGPDVGEDTLRATAAGLPALLFTAAVQNIGPPANIAKYDGDGQTGLAGFAVNIPPAVRVTDTAGIQTSNVTVTFTVATDGGSVTGAVTQTDSHGIARVGSWTLGSTPGQNSLDATVTGVGTVTFTATGAAAAYNILVRFVTSVTPSQRRVFQDAAARWGELIFGDLSDILVQVPDGTCGNNSPAIDEVVDDLLIFATVDSIDGPGMIVGQAGPCLIRSSNRLPVVGVMTFDESDLTDLEAAGHLDEVILHEMGHVIGFGTLWEDPSFNLLAGAGGSDPHFVGPRAIEAFDRIGGVNYTGGAKVPVENTGGPATRDSHWRESVFNTELMTSSLDGGVPNPLSEVTTASFWDMGYLVNLDGSEAYTLPVGALRLAGGSKVELVEDILDLPIYVVGSGGRIVDVLPSR